MNRSEIFQTIAGILRDSGAVAVGSTKAEPVDEKGWLCFAHWLEKNRHAGMEYMKNHSEIRRDPRLLLEGAQSIISMMFPFKPPFFRENERGMIACYAYGDDYHDVIRNRLKKAIEKIEKLYGGGYRICVDSAPIMERYWAVKTKIGEIGENGSIISRKAGNMCFLAEIITTIDLGENSVDFFEPTISETLTCLHCGKCREACPAGAILPDYTVDSNRCLSYLTIEHRGEWIEDTQRETMRTAAGKNTIFGCDICLRICPLNRDTPSSSISEFYPREDVMTLTIEDVKGMSQTEFSRIFKGSAIKRCKLNGLKRNIGSNIE